VNATGDEVWHFTTGGNIVTSPVIGDLNINNNGTYEIVFAAMDGYVYCLDWAGSKIWDHFTNTPYGDSPALCKVNNDDYLEIAITNQYGVLNIYNYTGGVMDSVSLGANTYTSIIALDLEDQTTGYTEFLLGCDDFNLYCYTWHTSTVTNNAEWSGFHGSNSRSGQIDFDGDGLCDVTESYYGTNSHLRDSDSDKLLDRTELFYSYTNPINSDTDYDDLDDWEEFVTEGTDPLDPDSDDEGLLDGEEVNIWYTDPLDPDTDNDNLTDFEECITYLTNPLIIDSDSDGLNDTVEIYIYHTDPHRPSR